MKLTKQAKDLILAVQLLAAGIVFSICAILSLMILFGFI